MRWTITKRFMTQYKAMYDFDKNWNTQTMKGHHNE